jgi:hypothetical protein
MRRPTAITAFLAVALITVSGVLFYQYGRSFWHPTYMKYGGARTVADVIEQYGEEAFARLVPAFSRAGLVYPPVKVALLILKAERSLEVWAFENDEWHFIKEYPIKGASGTAGPKLREGDRQVPEGVYRIIGLNPNSIYHLSMKLNYPNAFDLRHAKAEGRSQLGNNIHIHGNTGSDGCLAMGDEAIEDLFFLVAEVGKDNAMVVIAPNDPRTEPLPRSLPNTPPWLPELYGLIEAKFRVFTK